MRVLLDTDHFSVLQRNEQPAASVLQLRLDMLRGEDVAVSVISFQEQAQGWLAYVNKARKPTEVTKGFAALRQLIHHYSAREVLSFDLAAHQEFLTLRQQRIRIGTSDLRIAAIVRVRGLKLLSRNLRDFRQVPGLDVEDWTV